MRFGPAPRSKPYHMAKWVDADGNVYPLCSDFFRPINLERGLWANRAEAVTCRKCKRRLLNASAHADRPPSAVTKESSDG
jgi:hypothetical protein